MPARAPSPRGTWLRAERLRNKKAIGLLFQKGKRLRLGPLSLYALSWQKLPVDIQQRTHPVYSQVLFAIPKRHLARAVDRNRIRRRLRAAYCMHRDILAAHPPQEAACPWLLAFVYNSPKLFSFHALAAQLSAGLQDLRHTP